MQDLFFEDSSRSSSSCCWVVIHHPTTTTTTTTTDTVGSWRATHAVRSSGRRGWRIKIAQRRRKKRTTVRSRIKATPRSRRTHRSVLLILRTC